MGRKKKKSLAEDAAQKPSVTWAPLPSSWELRRDGGSPPFSFIYLFLYFFSPPGEQTSNGGWPWGLGSSWVLILGWPQVVGGCPLQGLAAWLSGAFGAGSFRDSSVHRAFRWHLRTRALLLPSVLRLFSPPLALTQPRLRMLGLCLVSAARTPGGASGVFCELRWIALGFL